MSLVTRQQVVMTARGYIGTPFHHQGRGRFYGIDCVGLVICVAQDLRLSEFDYTDYRRMPDVTLFRSLLREHLDIKPKNSAVLGDVLAFSYDRGRLQHLGIVSGMCPFKMIHCHHKHGVREDTINTVNIGRALRWIGTYSFKGVEPWLP